VDHQDLQEVRDLAEVLDLQDLLDLRDHQVPPDLPEHRVPQEPWVVQDLQDHLVFRWCLRAHTQPVRHTQLMM
jgi:hypothetical protein